MLDLAVTHARFSDYDPAGNHIPGAPDHRRFGAASRSARAPAGSAPLRLRYFGPRPLIEDDTRALEVTTLAQRPHRLRLRERRQALRSTSSTSSNTKASQIDYFYASRLPGEPAEGVADRHFHPVEPTAVRLTLAASL